jgi:glycosyltransferase involved in cell wall biosynthesis
MYRRKLEADLGDSPVYISLSELRDLSKSKIWKRLRSVRGDRIIIPIEDEGAIAVLPFLKLLAGVTSASKIQVIFSDLSQAQASRWSLLSDLISITRSSIRGGFAASAAGTACKSILRAPRISAAASDSNRVLYINMNLWFGVKAGGSVGHVAGVANALSKMGYEVSYASPADNSMVLPAVNRLLLNRPNSFGFPLENTLYSYDRTATGQLNSMVSGSYSFIYQRMSLANFTGVTISRKYGLPYILEYNGSEAWVAKNWGRPLKNHQLAVMAEDVCLKHAHVVVTISDVLKQELQERGVEADRIACYPNCVDEDLFNPERHSKDAIRGLRDRYNIDPDATVIGFIGTFGVWHGADILARAIRELIVQQQQWLREHKVHFLLMGDGAKMPLVKQALGEDRSPFWTLTGLIAQSEAPAHLAATDILVSPHVPNPDGTPFFGSPTKLFEYMAMGKTILASNLEQIGEVLRNSLRTEDLPERECTGGETELAVLCKPGDMDDLVRAIRFAVDRPAWRNLLGRNARKEALAKYTWKAHVTKFLETLDSVSRQP